MTGFRQALSSRAAVVLSGDALITGGIAVLLSRVTGASSLGGLSISVRIAAQTGMLLSVAASFMSVFHAMRSLDNRYAWRSRSHNRQSPDSPAFNHGDTLRMYGSFADFQTAQLSSTFPSMLNSAQVELWFVIRSHGYRYVQLRKSTRYLSGASARAAPGPSGKQALASR